MTSKKVKLQKELEAAVKAHEPSANSCPVCQSTFTCLLSKEAHFKLHPNHLQGHEDRSGKGEAVLVENLKGTVKHRKEPT